jgi:ATP-binding cassette subfamily F protein 3
VAAPVAPAPKPEAAPAGRAADRRKLAAGQREREKPLRHRLKAIDTRLATLAGERATLDARLLDANASTLSTSELAKLAQQQGALRAEQEKLEEEWLVVSGELEALASAEQA